MTKIIPELRMPTDEQHRQASAGWEAVAGPCLIDQWPNDLLMLSMPTIFIDLPRDCMGLFEPETMREFAAPIAEEIDANIGWNRKFFRLNSRSPKDAMWPLETPVSCSGKEILQVVAASERCLDDLFNFKYATRAPKLCLREFWPEVRPVFEYRCFIKNGDILAIAEYANAYTQNLWREPDVEHDSAIRLGANAYLREQVIPRLHINTVVVDLVKTHRGWKLLEINPYGFSDPVGARDYAAIERGIPCIARLPRDEREAA